jgi:hypothetical protein
MFHPVSNSTPFWAGKYRLERIIGDNHKAKTAGVLIDLCRKTQAEVFTIGLGDAPNDAHS